MKVKDLEFERNYSWVRKGKCNKDRLFVISEQIKPRVIDYIESADLSYDSYLFKGRKGCYSVRSVQEIVKKATKRAGIKKKIHAHTLRHSFATHLIENGYSVQVIQSLFGYKNAETTMVYVHLSSPKMINVKSPYDDL